MQMVVTPTGQIQCLYEELIELNAMGTLSIQRASYVEPDEQGLWWADLSPVNGPVLGPFAQRSLALAAERQWLEENWLAAID
jgi:hypothetical protein